MPLAGTMMIYRRGRLIYVYTQRGPRSEIDGSSPYNINALP